MVDQQLRCGRARLTPAAFPEIGMMENLICVFELGAPISRSSAVDIAFLLPVAVVLRSEHLDEGGGRHAWRCQASGRPAQAGLADDIRMLYSPFRFHLAAQLCSALPGLVSSNRECTSPSLPSTRYGLPLVASTR